MSVVSTIWTWRVASLAWLFVQIGLVTGCPMERVMRGVATRAAGRAVPFLRTNWADPLFGGKVIGRLLAVWLLAVAVDVLVGHVGYMLAFWTVMGAPWLDDWLTGDDDDRWKRRRARLRAALGRRPSFSTFTPAPEPS